jgi:hypothetical protein
LPTRIRFGIQCLIAVDFGAKIREEYRLCCKILVLKFYFPHTAKAFVLREVQIPIEP